MVLTLIVVAAQAYVLNRVGVNLRSVEAIGILVATLVVGLVR